MELVARVTSHIPDKGQVMVRYYGLYANAHRGKVRKANRVPVVLGPRGGPGAADFPGLGRDDPQGLRGGPPGLSAMRRLSSPAGIFSLYEGTG